MNMRTLRTRPVISAFLSLALWFGPASAHAQTTAFTYQGRLTEGGVPASGTYDFRFSIYDSTSVPGTVVSGPLALTATDVSNGLFSVALDFGDGAFTGADRWLDIGVRTNEASAFTTLSARQPLTPTPYAIRSLHASSALSALSADTAHTVITGAVDTDALMNHAVTSAKIEDGTITSADLSPAVTSNTFWRLDGNTGTVPGTHFLGTADGQPLELHAGGERVLRAEAVPGSGPRWIAGHAGNIATGQGATVGGGGIPASPNEARGNWSTVAGGFGNVVNDRADYGTVGGGVANRVDFDATNSVIAGGYNNQISPFAADAVVGGGYSNNILDRASESFIGGGYGNRIQRDSRHSVLVGGLKNSIQTDSTESVVGGGEENTIAANSSYATIGGGALNTIATNSEYATIGGGVNNDATNSATVGGGYGNSALGVGSTIGGGGSLQDSGRNFGNTTFAFLSTIGGGSVNRIEANCPEATISGGINNTILAGSGRSTIGGGVNNTLQPNADFAVIPGGHLNSATNYAFAAGHRAKANHTGAFVWADSTNADFASTMTDQFNIRAQGGVRIDCGTGPGISLDDKDRPLITRRHNPFTSGNYLGAGRWGLFMEPHTLVLGMPALAGKTVRMATYNEDGTYTSLMTLDQAGNMTIAGAYSPSSDRHAKEHFADINPTEVLEKVAALPISRWNFRQDAGTEHIGPMAQDFHAAFGLGTDERHIATVDADGVALAAIQGLNQKLERENAELRRRLDRLEALLNR